METKLTLDKNQIPHCRKCGENIGTKISCTCGSVNLKRDLPARFSNYDIMAHMGFGNNPQETHHNPAAWNAVNAWREVNVYWVGNDWDGYEMYSFND